MAKVSPARRISTRVLHRVATQGAYASVALDAEIKRERPDERDAGLATEIVYGALRVLPALDAALDAFLRRPEIDPLLRAAMRVAAYQIVHLSRVPVHACVHDAVEIVRNERSPKLAGVANAVLRRIQRPESPDRPTRLIVPEWIERELETSLGEERVKQFLLTREIPPPLGLRAIADRASLLDRLREARPEARFEASPLSEQSIAARGAGDPRRLPGYDTGAFVVQEIGSQLVANAVQAQPGEQIADLCCGHGGKTAVLARQVGAGGKIVAVDRYEEKLDKLQYELRRLKLPAVEAHAIDLSVGTGGLPLFDRVLLDAPCTGLGTVHRRPELLLRLEPTDPARMHELQEKLLRNAAALVKPGGFLIYAVCSPSRAELCAAPEGFETIESLQVGPWLDPIASPDAYQVVRWRRLP